VGGDEDGKAQPTYRIVQKEIKPGEDHSGFEAASYTWGDPTRVSNLPIDGEEGSIGLTKNLTEALPHFAKRSVTKYLWIDQICINQV
jgi:hypothetical protein